MASMINKTSKPQRYWDVFLLGSPSFIERQSYILGQLSFLTPQDFAQWTPEKINKYFVVVEVDYGELADLHKKTVQISSINHPQCELIFFVAAPEKTDVSHFLHAQELGVRQLCSGTHKEKRLRDYLKQACMEAERLDELPRYEKDLANLLQKNDRKNLMALDEELSKLKSKNQEGILRLRALIHDSLNSPKRAEYFLKKILTINPQNLWAANKLSRILLKTKRYAEAAEILNKLGLFNNLNAERFLNLGKIYLNAGQFTKASQALEQGHELSGHSDERFTTELQKVRLIQGQSPDTDTPVNPDVISYLNTQAILMIKQGQFDQGLKIYQTALEYAGQDNVLKAKLHFNTGLGYIRAHQPDAAIKHFEQSCTLGGSQFARAARPLKIARKMAAIQQHSNDLMSDRDWNNFDLSFEEFNIIKD